MDYSVTFWLRATGDVISGPKTGDILMGAQMAALDAKTVADAVAKAESYRGMFVGRIEIYSEQWYDRNPNITGEGVEFIQSHRKRSGKLVRRNLAVVELA